MITWRNKIAAWWSVTLPQWIAWKLPRIVVYFTTIRLFAHATTTSFTDRSPDQVDIWDALGDWLVAPPPEGGEEET